MIVNDLLSRALGLRIVREGSMRQWGLYARRDASAAINVKYRKSLVDIEKFLGKTLTPALRRQADEYAKDVLGDLEYAPSLHFYSAMQGRFREGWMPENFYHLVVVPRISFGFAEISSKKSLSNRILRTPALPDIAYYIGGDFYDRDYTPIDRVKLTDLAKPYGAVFVKGDDSGRGEKVRKVAAKALMDYPFDGNCVIQRAIQQHPFFEEFVAGVVATLRITTVKSPSGHFGMREAAVRFGRSGAEWLTAGENVAAQIVDGMGTLDELAYTSDWNGWKAHPDTGTMFGGRQVPYFADAVALCESLHAVLPHVAIVGWDVAIDADGKAELIEWNAGHCGIAGPEALIGPLFADLNWERFADK